MAEETGSKSTRSYLEQTGHCVDDLVADPRAGSTRSKVIPAQIALTACGGWDVDVAAIAGATNQAVVSLLPISRQLPANLPVTLMAACSFAERTKTGDGVEGKEERRRIHKTGPDAENQPSMLRTRC